jgi:hypothetical protein
MANITEAYEIPSAVGSPKEQGPGGFWVAVLESPERNTSEVVGYVGLGAYLFAVDNMRIRS